MQDKVTRSCLYGLSYIENASKRKKLCFSSWRRYFWITHLSRNCALPVKGDIMLLSVWGDFVFYLFKTLDYICLRRHKVYLFKEILFHIYLRRHKVYLFKEILSVIYVCTRGQLDCITLKHFCIAWGEVEGCTVVLKGSTISMPIGRHVDYDLILSLKTKNGF